MLVESMMITAKLHCGRLLVLQVEVARNTSRWHFLYYLFCLVSIPFRLLILSSLPVQFYAFTFSKLYFRGVGRVFFWEFRKRLQCRIVLKIRLDRNM